MKRLAIKKYSFINGCIPILLLLAHVESFGQLTSLFQMPYQNLDLPIFNPAYTGDTERDRAYTIFSSFRPRDASMLDSWNSVIGYDKKFVDLQSNFQFTLGGSFIYNEVTLELDRVNTKYKYGTLEVNAGGRLVTKYNTSKKGTKQSPGKKNKKSSSSLSMEAREFLAPINNTKSCSRNSAVDFLAFNFLVNYNYSSLTDPNNFIFDNQIIANQLSQNIGPFSYNRFVSDPTISNQDVFDADNIDFGFGLLYHKKIQESILRIGYSTRNLTRGYLGIPESAQRVLPTKVLNASYLTLINDRFGFNLNAIYIEQSNNPYLDFGNFNQWRIELTSPYYVFYPEQKVKEGFNFSSLELGFSLQFIETDLRIVSPIIGMRFLSNTDKKVVIPNQDTKRRNKNYTGNNWLFFFNWDYQLGNDLHFRDTYGNLRLGIIKEGW
ncbi:MAG: hypothetical protein AAF600_21470 [Bacteroidota bacterium]